jgi:hypothetical protein
MAREKTIKSLLRKKHVGRPIRDECFTLKSMKRHGCRRLHSSFRLRQSCIPRVRLAMLPPLRSAPDSVEHCQMGKMAPAPPLNWAESIHMISRRVVSGKKLLPTNSLPLPASVRSRTSPLPPAGPSLAPTGRHSPPPAWLPLAPPCQATAHPLLTGLAIARRPLQACRSLPHTRRLLAPACKPTALFPRPTPSIPRL